MSEERYHSKSQQRILQILLHLGGHEIYGLAPSEIAKSLRLTPNAVCRDLANLEYAGLAEKVPETGRWRLTPRISQIGLAMLSSLDRAQSKVDEVRQRYTRTPT